MADLIHIVEPTLENETGHCYSFIASLCAASQTTSFCVWSARGAVLDFPDFVDRRPYFFRRIRKIQLLFLYHSLLRQQGRILVSTATRTDLLLLHFAAPGVIPAGKVFLYVHWFSSTVTKQRQLEKIAAKQPNLTIIAPTKSVVEQFLAAGFKRVQYVPYPVTQVQTRDFNGAEKQGFRHLLYAGAAREDKGFPLVIDLVELLSTKRLRIPVVLQTSAQHYDKYDALTRTALLRLEGTVYSYLQRITDTLHQAEYHALYGGAICLQLYSPQAFADRVSGVTLDALSMGSPVVTLAGTWIADIVSEFDAGIVLESAESALVLDAVVRIMADYTRYQEHALTAGRVLQQRNSAVLLLHELTA